MATKISWCDETINPIIGCQKISRGCKHCYAEKMAARLARMETPGYPAVVRSGKWSGVMSYVQSAWWPVLGWKAHRTIFVGSMGDLFLSRQAFIWVDEVANKIRSFPQHTFIFLTKRPEIMKEWAEGYVKLYGSMLGNLVLGVSVEDQKTADERLPILADTPAVKRFISLEPMVAPVSFRWMAAWPENAPTTAEKPGGPTNHLDGLRRFDGVILGGESGAKDAACLNPTWVRTIRDQCAEAGTAFMFKQGSGVRGKHWKEYHDGWPVLDGEIHTALPWSVR